MFPVISNLRRAAVKVVYTTTPDVQFSAYHFCLDLESKDWKKSKSALMSLVEVSAESPFERALKLCVFENELYEQAGADKLQYTLIVGPETEAGATRSVRMGIVKGILISKNGGGLAPPIKKERAHSTRRPLPPGVVLDER